VVPIPDLSREVVGTGICGVDCHGNTVDPDRFCVEVDNGNAYITRMDVDGGWTQTLTIKNKPTPTTTEPLPG
jgi:hypothetical protein